MSTHSSENSREEAVDARSNAQRPTGIILGAEGANAGGEALPAPNIENATGAINELLELIKNIRQKTHGLTLLVPRVEGVRDLLFTKHLVLNANPGSQEICGAFLNDTEAVRRRKTLAKAWTHAVYFEPAQADVIL